jgi:hypothetical protein
MNELFVGKINDVICTLKSLKKVQNHIFLSDFNEITPSTITVKQYKSKGEIFGGVGSLQSQK